MTSIQQPRAEFIAWLIRTSVQAGALVGTDHPGVACLVDQVQHRVVQPAVAAQFAFSQWPPGGCRADVRVDHARA